MAAAARVLLPMQLAFNVLVPAGAGWRTILVLGNLSLLAAPVVLTPPDRNHSYRLHAVDALLLAPSGAKIAVAYDDRWHPTEHGNEGYRVWSQGSAAVTITNPHARPILVRLRFEMNAEGARLVQMRLGERSLWSVTIPEGAKVSASLPRIELAPGANRIEFGTDLPPRERAPDPRQLAFCLHNLRIDVQGFAADAK